MIASRSNLKRYGSYEIEIWQPPGFSTDRMPATKAHIQDQSFAVHVITHMNIEKRAKVESQVFLAGPIR